MENQLLTIKEAKDQISKNIMLICKYQRLGIYLGKLVQRMNESLDSDDKEDVEMRLLMIEDVKERLTDLQSELTTKDQDLMIRYRFYIIDGEGGNKVSIEKK